MRPFLQFDAARCVSHSMSPCQRGHGSAHARARRRSPPAVHNGLSTACLVRGRTLAPAAAAPALSCNVAAVQRSAHESNGGDSHLQVLLYSKLAKSYFVFLEALCHNHHAFLVRQPHDTFACIMRCLELGVKSLDVTTSSQCAMAIDNLATWVHQNLIKVDELHQVHPAAQVRPLPSWNMTSWVILEHGSRGDSCS